MDVKVTEHELLGQAINAFKHETGLPLQVIAEQTREKGLNVDAIIQLADQKEPLAVEIKQWAQQINLGALIEQIQRLPMPGVLVADYVNPKMAKKLKEENVQYIDAVGNAYINQLPIYVYVVGNKQQLVKGVTKEANRAFDATGLKVVFGFLCDLELVNATYREIAERTGVALGTVGWVINGLKNAGMIIDRGKGKKRRLVNKRKILDRWVEAYPEKLKPKQRVGEYIADNPDWWEDIDMAEYAGYWGGEVAGAKYTNHLRPQVTTIYLPKYAGKDLLAKARLRKQVKWTGDEHGLVKIYRPFWPEHFDNQANQNNNLAHPILVYTDLIATGDVRNIETARMIYEQYIAEHFRAD